MGTDPAIDRLNAILSRVLGLAPEEITDAASTHTVEGWDSLKHINLILALEEEFGVALKPEDVESMISVGLIKDVLREQRILPT